MKSLIIVMVLSLVFAVIRAIKKNDRKWRRIVKAKKNKRQRKKKRYNWSYKDKGIMEIKPTPKNIIGILLIIFAILDFFLSLGGINLTPFLPSLISQFTPIVIGGIGFVLLTVKK